MRTTLQPSNPFLRQPQYPIHTQHPYPIPLQKPVLCPPAACSLIPHQLPIFPPANCQLPTTHLTADRSHHVLGKLGKAAVSGSRAIRRLLLTLHSLANVAGTQEPIYGPTAIQPVKSTDQVPYTEITKEDLKWKALSSTSVETQTFYFTTDSGHIAFAQVIYSNVA